MKTYKKYLAFILILFLIVPAPVFAKKEKTIVTIQEQINSEDKLAGISFKAEKELILSQGKVVIPENSIVYAYILDTQAERRGLKNGFAVCKLKGYSTSEAENEKYTDIEQDDIYMVARTYKALDKKEVGIKTAEVAATTAASFVVFGANIAYYFTKGMMHKQEGKTRFKSGVSSVYENSIFRLWMKGKPVDLDEDSNIVFKEITRDKAVTLIRKIQARNERAERIQQRKENLKEFIN